jgi:hypothetical protein
MYIEEAPPSAPRVPVPPPAPARTAAAGTAPAAGDMGMLQAWNLKRRLLVALGNMAQEVQVEQQPDRTLLVKVRVASEAMEKRATEMILKLPEMASPRVRLQMNVGAWGKEPTRP